MLAIFVAGWFLCGLLGIYLGLKILVSEGGGILADHVLWVLTGPSVLIMIAVYSVAKAMERKSQ